MLGKEVTLTTFGCPSHCDYFSCTPCYASGLCLRWLIPFQSAAACWPFWQKTLSLQSAAPFYWCQFPRELSPVLHLINVSFTSSRSLFRFAHARLYALYMEGTVLASWPPGSVPCSLAPLQHQLTFFWQLSLTFLLVNPSHSQETVRPEIIVAAAKTIYRAARSGLTLGCFNHCVTCMSWCFENGCTLGHMVRGKCHLPGIRITRTTQKWSAPGSSRSEVPQQ